MENSLSGKLLNLLTDFEQTCHELDISTKKKRYAHDINHRIECRYPLKSLEHYLDRGLDVNYISNLNLALVIDINTISPAY